MRRQWSGFVCTLFTLAVVVLACRGPGEGETHAVSPEKAKEEAEPGTILSAGPTQKVPPAALEPASSESPAIRFDETEFDFGEAEAGENVEHLFRFRNVGTRTLTIEKVGST